MVFKKGVPDSVVQQIYSEMQQLYSGERLVAAAGGRQVRVMEVRVSRLVRDAQGRYMFRVADSPDGAIPLSLTTPSPVTLYPTTPLPAAADAHAVPWLWKS